MADSRYFSLDVEVSDGVERIHPLSSRGNESETGTKHTALRREPKESVVSLSRFRRLGSRHRYVCRPQNRDRNSSARDGGAKHAPAQRATRTEGATTNGCTRDIPP